MRKIADRIANNRIIWCGTGLGVLFWVLESVLHAFIFSHGTFIGQLISPELHELWMRLMVISLIMLSSALAQNMINKSRQSENAIKSVYAELDQIFNTAADGMRVIDRDFNILRVNDTFSTLAKIDKDDVVGKKCYEVFKGPKCHTPECPLTQIIGGKDRVEFDVEKVRNDGTLVPCILTATPFRGADGELIGTVENFKDITERKRIEEDLRKAKEELEHKVRERTVELSRVNEELKVWINELEQRNREMSLMSEMGDLLQSCADVEEAYLIISQYVQKLFPEDSGALYMFRASRNIVEEVSKWGENLNSQSMFTTDDCWSLRRGKMHVVESLEKGLVCRHVGSDARSYLCLPMTAQGELMGILHLQSKEPLSEFKKRVALNAAEHFALTFSNLKLREILRNQAIRDPLTGLFNRRYMEETLDRELSRAIRNKAPVGVIMIDLDYFKRFNDEFGHDAGDTVLQELGNFLQKYIRKEDIACRYGGEEFAIILSGASLEITYQRADLLRENVKNLEVLYKNQKLPGITLSFGVAVFPDHGPTGEAVLIAADTALYRAKQEGRDRVVIA